MKAIASRDVFGNRGARGVAGMDIRMNYFY